MLPEKDSSGQEGRPETAKNMNLCPLNMYNGRKYKEHEFAPIKYNGRKLRKQELLKISHTSRKEINKIFLEIFKKITHWNN